MTSAVTNMAFPGTHRIHLFLLMTIRKLRDFLIWSSTIGDSNSIGYIKQSFLNFGQKVKFFQVESFLQIKTTVFQLFFTHKSFFIENFQRSCYPFTDIFINCRIINYGPHITICLLFSKNVEVIS